MTIFSGYPIYEIELKIFPNLTDLKKNPNYKSNKKTHNLEDNIRFWNQHFQEKTYVTHCGEIVPETDLRVEYNNSQLQKRLKMNMQDKKYSAIFNLLEQIENVNHLRMALTYLYNCKRSCNIYYDTGVQIFSVKNEKIFVDIQTFDPSGYTERLNSTRSLAGTNKSNF